MIYPAQSSGFRNRTDQPVIRVYLVPPVYALVILPRNEGEFHRLRLTKHKTRQDQRGRTLRYFAGYFVHFREDARWAALPAQVIVCDIIVRSSLKLAHWLDSAAYTALLLVLRP
jgi:hypothetical protein